MRARTNNSKEEHSKRVKIDGLGHGKKSLNMGRDI